MVCGQARRQDTRIAQYASYDRHLRSVRRYSSIRQAVRLLGCGRFSGAAKRVQRKRVFIDDCLIGEAATWGEVHAQMKTCGIFFINPPRGAEGPSGFYLEGTAVERRVSPAVG